MSTPIAQHYLDDSVPDSPTSTAWIFGFLISVVEKKMQMEEIQNRVKKELDISLQILDQEEKKPPTKRPPSRSDDKAASVKKGSSFKKYDQ